MRLILLGMLVAAAMGMSATAATPPRIASAATIAAAARKAMAQTGARGLAIAVINHGRVRSVQAFGARNAAGDPLRFDTIMYGASLTKAVFAYYAMMLVDDRRLVLDQPIAALLPRPLPDYGNLDAYGNWGDLAGDDRWRRITPRHVLNHATGFANFAFLEPDQKLRFHFDPGARYAYSGEGIMLLQFAIEQGLGLDLEQELERRLFTPLGMRDTSLIWRNAYKGRLADGWDDKGRAEAHDERSRVRAAGSMDTTIADMAVFAAAVARGWGLSARARADYARGTLPITTRTQFPTLQPELPLADRPAAKAALGVIAFNGPQGPGFYKGGHNDTTGNTLVCVERGQRCVVILANDVRAEAAFPALVRTILGETGVPYGWEYGL